jgi:thioredoxin reductase (NADPH)
MNDLEHNTRTKRSTRYDLVIIGGGPSGLACALEAKRRGLDYIVLEKGTVVNTIVGYPTFMTFFSTPDLLELGDMPFTSPNFRPTRVEAIEYYRGVVRKGGLNISLQDLVQHVQPFPGGEFMVRAQKGDCYARYIVLATGYFDNTNKLGVLGETLAKVHHYYQEPFAHYGQDVAVIGGRNSAVETALDLYRHGARVTLIHRGGEFGRGVKYWVRPDIDNRIKKGEIRVMWNTEVESIHLGGIIVRNNLTDEREEFANDAVFAMIGYRPDVGLLDVCGIRYDPETLIPEFDPATFETNIPNFFIAGSVACGCKTWEIFIENGRAHATVVIDEIARRHQESKVES